MKKFSQSTHRVLLGAVLALTAFVIFTPSSSSSARAAEQSPIVTAALRYLDTHGGQCWTFMKQVVQEATGRSIGFDYRQGYFDAGAVEVSPSEATSGDIIQIARDGNTGPWVSYPGLHTAIIMENLGGGRFNAIDSNQNWDEWVRLRPNYDPYASAARYGLQVHIYRIPGGSTADAPATSYTAPGSTPAYDASNNATWAAGDSAVVTPDSGCLNLRTSPSLAGDRITCLPSGTPATVVDGPVSADGYTWIKIETSAGTGWVAAQYMTQTASVTAVAAASTSSDSVAAVVEEAPAPAAASSLPSDVVGILYVDNSPGCLRLRATPDTDGSIVDCLKAGTTLQVLSQTIVPAGGYNWINVRTSSGEGWVANAFVVE